VAIPGRSQIGRGALALRQNVRLRQVVSVVLFGVLPLAMMIMQLRKPGLGWDFRVFYLGARHYLDGASPYSGHSLAVLADKRSFVYPAPMAALFVPFALLPYTLALGLWLLGSVLAVAVGLRALGVGDWRCCGALFLTAPAQQGVRLGTLMPVLMLLIALLWKYRDRVAIAAVTCAIVALSKVFLFPLLIWLAVTRRLKTALLAITLVASLCLIGWLPIHLASIGAYPSLLHALARYEQTFSYSLTSFGIALGFSSTIATSFAIVAGVVLVSIAAAVGRSSEFLAFRLMLAASFVLSPIVWGHYFVLLAVPLALSWPRLSPIWLAAIWIKPDTLGMHDTPVWIGCALFVMILQLDLAHPLRRWWAERMRHRPRQSFAVAITAALLIATNAAAEPGQTRNVALKPTRGGLASGAAAVRIDRPDRELCWRLWTEALRAGKAQIAIQSNSGAHRRLVASTVVGPDGQSHGCTQLTRADALVAAGLTRKHNANRLTLTARDTAPIAGSFRVP
jgi:glycosyl transferase family 87